MIENYKSIHYLTDYITEREHEIEEYNEKNQINRNNIVNGRALTNIGIFRSVHYAIFETSSWHPSRNDVDGATIGAR